jgi:endonuclease/exonuclease/phosphatase family metal-dependent hydrolase
MQEAVDESGEGKQPSGDLQERMAGVASRAAIVCSYDEEARHVERQSRVLSAHLETLENERLKGIHPLVSSPSERQRVDGVCV